MKTKKKVQNTLKEETKSPTDIFLAKYITPEWLPLINMYKTEQVFKAGDRIFSEGDEVSGIYIINSGKVKVVSQYEKDKERILRLAGDGKFLGHRGIAFPLYPVSAIALTDTSVCFFPRGIFIKLVKANPEFSLYMLDFISKELYDSEERMKNIIHHDVKMRVAEIICMVVDAFGYDKNNKFKLSYSLSRKDIANLAGTTYETVIRILLQLQKMKLIQVEGKSIIVQREFELRKLAGQKVS